MKEIIVAQEKRVVGADADAGDGRLCPRSGASYGTPQTATSDFDFVTNDQIYTTIHTALLSARCWDTLYLKQQLENTKHAVSPSTPANNLR